MFYLAQFNATDDESEGKEAEKRFFSVCVRGNRLVDPSFWFDQVSAGIAAALTNRSALQLLLHFFCPADRVEAFADHRRSERLNEKGRLPCPPCCFDRSCGIRSAKFPDGGARYSTPCSSADHSFLVSTCWSAELRSVTCRSRRADQFGRIVFRKRFHVVARKGQQSNSTANDAEERPEGVRTLPLLRIVLRQTKRSDREEKVSLESDVFHRSLQSKKIFEQSQREFFHRSVHWPSGWHGDDLFFESRSGESREHREKVLVRRSRKTLHRSKRIYSTCIARQTKIASDVLLRKHFFP